MKVTDHFTYVNAHACRTLTRSIPIDNCSLSNVHVMFISIVVYGYHDDDFVQNKAQES
jgi:hypothetical protein